MFDINRTKDVYNLILKMWNENQQLKQRIDDAIEFIDIYTDGINLGAFDCLKLMYKVKEILEGGSNE